MLRHDKLVDGLEAAHFESQHREDVEERGEDELPIAQHAALASAEHDARGQLLGTIRLILEQQTDLQLRTLGLPEREQRAIEALHAAVTGHGALGEFLYAEDRRDLLERALAELQPSLSRTDDATLAALHGQLDDLSTRVAELRDQLNSLEDAQGEIIEGGPRQAKATQPPDPSDPDAPRPPSTLAGPGPDAPEPARPPSSLTGPELPPETKPPSSLGDPAELAELAEQPWWRKPFG